MNNIANDRDNQEGNNKKINQPQACNRLEKNTDRMKNMLHQNKAFAGTKLELSPKQIAPSLEGINSRMSETETKINQD